MANAVILLDSAGRIEMVNAQGENMFGLSREVMVGQPAELLVPPRLRWARPFGHDPIRRGFAEDSCSDQHGLRGDGSEFPIEIGLNTIETSAGPKTLAVVVDLSQHEERENELLDAIREREALLGEVHHRVKNNLQVIHSLLDLQISRITDPVVIGMLRDSQNRVRSMALIHQTLYQSKDFGRVDLAHFIDYLVPMLIASFGMDGGRVVLRVSGSGVLLPIDNAVPCALIINELLSNALEHAFPDDRHGEIRLELHRSGSDIQILVSDDGVGIGEEVDLDGGATLGFQLVGVLAQQLHGRLDIQRRGPTRFALHFPIRR